MLHVGFLRVLRWVHCCSLHILTTLDYVYRGHFADDTFVLCSSKKPKTLETVINNELKGVIKWLRLNKLSLNAAKTELIIFRSNRHPVNYNNISIKFNGHKLTPVSQVKYLGMYRCRPPNCRWPPKCRSAEKVCYLSVCTPVYSV